MSISSLSLAASAAASFIPSAYAAALAFSHFRSVADLPAALPGRGWCLVWGATTAPVPVLFCTETERISALAEALERGAILPE